MNFEQYWIGKGIDLEQLWRDYDAGRGYVQKVRDTEVHMLRFTFRRHPRELPLFCHEATYKTVKGSFHDVKRDCLSSQAYDRAAPIFLYRVDRGSALYEFLAELDPALTFLTVVGGLLLASRQVTKQDLEIDEKKWKFIRAEFPGATDADLSAFMKAWTSRGRRKVLERLIKEGLHKVEISRSPMDCESDEVPDLVDFTDLLDQYVEGP